MFRIMHLELSDAETHSLARGACRHHSWRPLFSVGAHQDIESDSRQNQINNQDKEFIPPASLGDLARVARLD
jgi:hypothetical protein